MNLTLEWALYCKVKSLEPLANTFDNVTTTEERMQNLKHTIQKIGPDVLYKIVDGKPITLRMMWSRIYSRDWE